MSFFLFGNVYKEHWKSNLGTVIGLLNPSIMDKAEKVFFLIYCKFEIFCKNFIFLNSVKRHIWDVENARLRHDLHISVNDRVISEFGEDFIFTKLRIYEVSRK